MSIRHVCTRTPSSAVEDLLNASPETGFKGFARPNIRCEILQSVCDANGLMTDCCISEADVFVVQVMAGCECQVKSTHASVDLGESTSMLVYS